MRFIAIPRYIPIASSTTRQDTIRYANILTCAKRLACDQLHETRTEN